VTDDDGPDDQFRKYLQELHEELRTGRNSGRYILNDAGEAEACDDLITWALWMEHGNRRVCQDMDEGEGAAKISVSTVFLGLDMRHVGQGEPILWETMVFGGPYDHEMRRYTSRDAAIAGHQEMCQKVSKAQPKPPK